jgi:hypothetical protein
MSVCMVSGPSTRWRMPAAIRSPLWRVWCSITASVPDTVYSSDSSGRSSTAAVRGSRPRSGSSSLATSSDWRTTRSASSTGAIS